MLATDILESFFCLIVNKHFVIVLFFDFTQISLTDRELSFVLQRRYSCYVDYFHVFFYFICYLYFMLTYISKCKYWQFYVGVLTPCVLFLHVSFAVDRMFCGLGVKSDLHIFSDSDKYAELCKLHSMYVCKMLYISTCPS